MLAQRSIGPRFASIEPVIGCIVSDKIDRELAPNDQLFEKRFFVLRRRIAIFHREGYREHADLAKMQIRRQLARAVEVRVITPAGVAIKPVAEEAPKCFLRGRVAVSKLRYGAIERSSGIRSSKLAPGADAAHCAARFDLGNGHHVSAAKILAKAHESSAEWCALHNVLSRACDWAR